MKDTRYALTTEEVKAIHQHEEGYNTLEDVEATIACNEILDAVTRGDVDTFLGDRGVLSDDEWKEIADLYSGDGITEDVQAAISDLKRFTDEVTEAIESSEKVSEAGDVA